jgi:hypothetical protein
MASEMRRMAKLLVASRSEAFASRYPRAESEARVKRAIEGFAPKGMAFEAAWREEPGAAVLDVNYTPTRGTRLFLHASSLTLIVLLAASLWARSAPVMIVTACAILAFPFLVVAYGSRREAEESTLRKKIRKAIVEEEEKPR